MAPRSTARDPRSPRLRLVAGAGRPRPSADEDAGLVADFERGAPGAGAALYDRLFPVVDATIVRIVGGRQQDHPDLVQSAFEQIVATLSRGSFGRGCSLAGWAAVLSCHVGLNALRARRRERGVLDRGRSLDAAEPARPQAAAAPHAEDHIEAREGLAAVRRHLSEMDPDRVTALLLHAMGHDLVEIAALTGTSVAAAQSRLSRGRRELRARIEGDVADGAAAARGSGEP